MGASSVSEHEARAGPGSGGFDLKFAGAAMELTVFPGGSGELPSAADILRALNDAPVDSILSTAVFAAAREAPPAPVVVAELRFEPGEPWVIKVAPSGMAAYVVPAPVAEDEDAPVVTADDLRRALADAKLTHGVQEEAVSSFEGGRALDGPVLVARGEPAVNCRQAEVTYLFDTAPSIAPSEHGDGAIDYRSLVIQRCVAAGAPLARRTAPVEGKNGRDVFGKEIVVVRVRDHPLSKHQGKGTAAEGETLVATQAGRPVLAGERVEVLPYYDVKKDVDFSVGNIDFSGDVIIHGDVHPGFRVCATGTVTIQGLVDRATIIAGGDIVARAVTGDEHTSIEAGKDVTAQYLHGVYLVAKGTVKVQREILHSHIEAGRVEVPAVGRIVGGRVTTTTEVTAGIIGSVQAIPTHVEVGSALGGKRTVIRAVKKVYFGSVIIVAHAPFAIDEDLGPSSFWAHEGQVVRLGPASTGPTETVAA